MIARRQVLAAGAAGSAALALSACGGDDGGGEVDGEGKTITMWLMEGTNANTSEYVTALSEAFTEQTGATLDVQVQPWDGAHDKFVTAMAGGTGPDVAEVGTTWVPEFADAGGIDDLTDDIEADGLAEGLIEGLAEAGTLEGRMYGMPWYAGVRSILANGEMLDEAGVNEQPESWDDLLSMITTLEEHNSDWIPFPIQGGSIFAAMPFVWGAGGEIATEDGGSWTAAINQPEAVEGLEWYTDLALEHDSSTSAANTWLETDTLAEFLQETVPMFITGSWVPATIRADNPELADKLVAFTLPAKDSAVAPSFLGGSLMCRFTETQEPELAFELIKLVTTGEFATRWAEETNYFPGTEEALNEVVDAGDELTQVFATQMLDGGKSVPVTPAWGKIEGAKTLGTMISSVLGGTSAQDAADTAAEEMDGFFGE
ncbi:MAG TPA: sugar ABC transporter substrate-binding protein [Candidatus Brachybacterium merdavium]|uniref:Sugar ABC transporter substrate-binding protein n=1 Tax=Candidatus Brachybacterium merdavium TaxID=2838513 RepID=A0A9D2LBS7_9MICO|nr:sugar ABC transporter substrate-binding protein [Candidatus Brachybacterium merdavium]